MTASEAPQLDIIVAAQLVHEAIAELHQIEARFIAIYDRHPEMRSDWAAIHDYVVGCLQPSRYQASLGGVFHGNREATTAAFETVRKHLVHYLLKRIVPQKAKLDANGGTELFMRHERLTREGAILLTALQHVAPANDAEATARRRALAIAEHSPFFTRIPPAGEGAPAA